MELIEGISIEQVCLQTFPFHSIDLFYFSKEYVRRKSSQSNVDDMLSGIEEYKPVLSDAEVLMNEQLKRYSFQIDSLKQK